VSQRGHIVKPTGRRKTWAIMYRDGDGNLRWEGKFISRADAQRRLTSVLGEIDKGTYTRPSSLTSEQFAKEWLAGRRQIRGSTESGYGSLIKSQLIPRLGSSMVSHVRFEHIDAAVSGMVEGEFAPKTIHNAVMLLRNMLAGRQGPSAFRRGLTFADHMGHSSIHVTFDTYGHLFPGRGKEASERFEKSMEMARKKARADVSNPLAMGVDRTRESETSN